MYLDVEYKDWIERKTPFASIEAELQSLAQQGANYRNLVLASNKSLFGRLAQFLRVFDVTTCYPLMLGFLSSGTNPDVLARVSHTIESYILRRAACGYSTKNYNNIFLAALVECKKSGFSHQTLFTYLDNLSSESAVFPSDNDFESAFLNNSAYSWGQKLRYILIEINRSLFTGKTEEIEFPVLTTEHLMPQR